MSYEKHTWETGEVITAEKLNNIESGIGGDVVALISSNDAFSIRGKENATFNDVYDEVLNGKMVVLIINSTESMYFPPYILGEVNNGPDSYSFVFESFVGRQPCYLVSPSGPDNPLVWSE